MNLGILLWSIRWLGKFLLKRYWFNWEFKDEKEPGLLQAGKLILGRQVPKLWARQVMGVCVCACVYEHVRLSLPQQWDLHGFPLGRLSLASLSNLYEWASPLPFQPQTSVKGKSGKGSAPSVPTCLEVCIHTLSLRRITSLSSFSP